MPHTDPQTLSSRPTTELLKYWPLFVKEQSKAPNRARLCFFLSSHKLSDQGGEQRAGQSKNIVDSTESPDAKPEQNNLGQNQDSFYSGMPPRPCCGCLFVGAKEQKCE